jgi:hypothetical protein
VDWRQRDSRGLLRVPSDISSSRCTHHCARAPLVWSTCLAKTSLRSSVALVERSRLVVRTTSRSSIRRHSPSSGDVTFLRLRSHFRVLPEIRHAGMHTDARTLPRFLAPTTQPTRRDPPPPSVCLPGSRCVLALTTCLDALLPRRAPWCPSNQVRPRGIALQSIT